MPQTESPIEHRFRTVWLQRARYIPLIPQYEVCGGRYRLDFAYPQAKIAIELDGYEYHKSYHVFTADRKRDRALQREGWRVLHFSGMEITHDVERCVDEARQTIEATQKNKVPISQQQPRKYPRFKKSHQRTKPISAAPLNLPSRPRSRKISWLISCITFVTLLTCWGSSALLRGRSISSSQPVVMLAKSASVVTAQNKQVVATMVKDITPAETSLMPSIQAQISTTEIPSLTVTPVTISLANTTLKEIGQVKNGGNLRSEHRISPTTVIGQVCPGDQLIILEQQSSSQQLWYRVHIVSLGVKCHPQRVVANTEGWLSSTLVILP